MNYAALFYNPVLQEKLTISLRTLADHILRLVINPGTDVIHSEYYPYDNDDIKRTIDNLHQYPVLAVDIETYSLEFQLATVATIGFAWSKHDGVAFPVAWGKNPEIPGRTRYRYKLLREFFESYKGKLIYHGATFDVKILIYYLWMKTFLNHKGLIKGLEIMYRDTECTKILTYLATNTTAVNALDLKSNAAEFMGNYAQEDIKDISRIPLPKLLTYNLRDCLATFYLYEKNLPIVIQDEQLELYETIMRPSMKVVTQMELTGMPMNERQIELTKRQLEDIEWGYEDTLFGMQDVQDFNKFLRLEAMISANEKLKKKVHPLSKFDDVVYNPGSPQQTAKLLHDYFDFPILDKTPTGQPSVGGDILKKLLTKIMVEHDLTEEDLQ